MMTEVKPKPETRPTPQQQPTRSQAPSPEKWKAATRRVLTEDRELLKKLA